MGDDDDVVALAPCEPATTTPLADSDGDGDGTDTGAQFFYAFRKGLPKLKKKKNNQGASERKAAKSPGLAIQCPAI